MPRLLISGQSGASAIQSGASAIHSGASAIKSGASARKSAPAPEGMAVELERALKILSAYLDKIGFKGFESLEGIRLRTAFDRFEDCQDFAVIGVKGVGVLQGLRHL